MINVFDVADYILSKTGPISAMKLQKLVYYCQAWSLVWEDQPIFGERIEAWASGPVVRELYEAHRGMFTVTKAIFLPYVSGENFSKEQIETMDIVLKAYKDKSAQWLSDQTHSEAPWQLAREGIPDLVRSSNEITIESMAEFYSSLT